MALTDGNVGYMLLWLGLEMGEMLCPETELGEWPEVYDMTLDAGVKAGVSAAEAESGARELACDEPYWLACMWGGELLDR